MIYNKQYECMPRGELRALQSERLIKTVKYVYENLPLYREKMKAAKVSVSDIKSVDDIYKLPFTTKKDLRGSYPFKMFSAPKSKIVRVHASSGTTGKLTVVGYTKNDIEMWSEVMARSLSSAGADCNSVIHVAYGYGLFTGGLGAHYGGEKLGAVVVPVSGGNTKRQLMLMKDFEADILCCTPSYAVYLADEIEKEGYKISDFKLKAGVFGAEPWTNAMRGEIEKKWHINAYDIYGLSEICGPGVAMECECKRGMHINEDHFIPEILDKETLQPLEYGKEGELVFTTITKEGMPLIRYRTMDITKLYFDNCECGRTFVKMNKVTGRTDDMLIIRGVNVFPSQIESALIEAGGDISPHYIIEVDRVNNLDTIEIKVEVSEKYFSDEVKKLEGLKRRLEDNINSMIGIGATVRLVEPNSIPRSEGKAKRVIDKRV